MSRFDALLSPVSVAGMNIKNRVAMAPMATDFAEGDGTVSERLIDYYEARAAGGVGLIIVEVCTVDGGSPYIPRTLGIWDDSFIPGLAKLAEAAHRYDCRIIPQIAHPGPESLAPLFFGTEAVGPSAGILNGLTGTRCRALASDEIPRIIEAFAAAARRARRAGFDGVEFHAAHGYMLAGSFLTALRNRRSDEYGGGLEGRLRFIHEAIAAMRAEAGSDFPITIRISAEEQVPGGRSLRETAYLAGLLADLGVAAFHVSNGVYPDLSWRVIPPTGTPFAINAEAARAIREASGVPVMLVGRIVEPGIADDLVRRGDADLVVLGRALLADPEWVNKAAAGLVDEIAPCVGCGLGCVRNRERGGDMTCIVNPRVGRERETVIRPAQKKKRVMVAGGGPAGLEASAVAASAGHEVVLYEKSYAVGGQYALASVPPGKQELSKVVRYLALQAAKAGVRMEMNVEVTPERVAAEKPDVLIVATGASPRRSIPGSERANVLTVHDVLSGSGAVQGRVLIAGGGMVGCEIALYLASGDVLTGAADEVTIVETAERVANDMWAESRALLVRELKEKGVKILTSATVKAITDEGVLINIQGEDQVLAGMDWIVLAIGAESEKGLASSEHPGCEVRVIGDAAGPRQVLEAIHEGFEIGRGI